jgi:glutathione S-transferase
VQLGPAVGAVFASTGKEQEAAVQQVHDNLALLEAELREGAFKGRRFFGGDQVGLLDVVLGCGSYWLAVFEEVTGVRLGHHPLRRPLARVPPRPPPVAARPRRRRRRRRRRSSWQLPRHRRRRRSGAGSSTSGPAGRGRGYIIQSLGPRAVRALRRRRSSV